MKAGSETKRKRGICLAGVVSAVLAGSVLLFPSAAGAETVLGGYSVPSQMEAITRKAGDAEPGGTEYLFQIHDGLRVCCIILVFGFENIIVYIE